VVTVGDQPPLRPAPGCIWVDTSRPDAPRLRVFREGGSWMDLLAAPLRDLGLAGPAVHGGMLIADRGSWSVLGPGGAGQALTIGPNGRPVWADFLRFGPKPPWKDHDTVPHPPTIWVDPAANAERLSWWCPDSRQWQGVYSNSPILDRLAELRAQYREGDLLGFAAGQIQRLGAGRQADRLTMRGGVPVWEPALHISDAAPAGHDGELWYQADRGVLRVRHAGEWQIANGTIWSDLNASGARLEPGTAVFLNSGGWKRVDASLSGSSQFGGLVVTGGDAGDMVAVAWGGVVTLGPSDWDAVIDPADGQAPGGLNPGRTYYASAGQPGMLSVNPASGLPIGQALDGTSLFLFPQADLGGGSAAARWFLGTLDPCLPHAFDDGDVLGWNGHQFGKAAWINGARTPIAIRHSSRLVDPVTGKPTLPGTPGAQAEAPTDTGLPNGVSFLRDGELFLGTNPADPALWWKLSDGSTYRFAGGGGPGALDFHAEDFATDPDAAQIVLDAGGRRREVVLRGADGIEVTATNQGTLVISGAALLNRRRPGIDGGRFSPKAAFRPGVTGASALDAGRFTLPEVQPPKARREIDAGDFHIGKP